VDRYRIEVGFRIVAYAAVGAHFAFLAFGVLGGFLAWRWPRLLRYQVAGVAWLVLVVVANLVCPLTWLEDRARERAGLVPKPGGFIANHVAGVFFPHGHQPAAMVVAGLVVLISWAGCVALRRRDRAMGEANIGHGAPQERTGPTRLR
jgi:hypothetical protein